MDPLSQNDLRTLVLLLSELPPIARSLLLEDLLSKGVDIDTEERTRLLSSAAPAFLPDFARMPLSPAAVLSASQDLNAVDADILLVTVKQPELYGTQAAFGIDPRTDED